MKLFYFSKDPNDRAYLTSKLGAQELVYVDGPLAEHHELRDSEADVISVFVNDHVGKAEMDRFPNLKLIATRSTGFDHVDLTEAKLRGITVCTVPAYGVATVAEFAFALLLSLTRRIGEAQARVKAGSFAQSGLQGVDLSGKTIGILGCGKIGAHAARIAKGFGMRVIVFDVYQNPALASEIGFTYVPLEGLLKSADIIDVHAPYTKETHRLINRENIKTVKKGAYLINTARGAIVETQAIIDGLKAGILAGAGLDVLEDELAEHEKRSWMKSLVMKPEEKAIHARHEELLSFPNVVVTPHVAFDSREAVERILSTTLENIAKFREGQPQNVVSK